MGQVAIVGNANGFHQALLIAITEAVPEDLTADIIRMCPSPRDSP